MRNDALDGPNPFEWKDVSTDEIFAGRNIVLFAVPGAFTPACSESHLPGYEKRYDEFRAAGIDAVYCLSVNDSMHVKDWLIQKVFAEPGFRDDPPGVGLEVSDADTMLAYLSSDRG